MGFRRKFTVCKQQKNRQINLKISMIFYYIIVVYYLQRSSL